MYFGDEERVKDLPLQGPDGPVYLTMKYASPDLINKWRQFCTSQGICRKDMEINPGRFDDYCKSIAQHFITACHGATPAGWSYSVEAMAKLLRRNADALQAVNEVSGEADSFFGSNGSGPTVS